MCCHVKEGRHHSHYKFPLLLCDRLHRGNVGIIANTQYDSHLPNKIIFHS